MGTETLNDRVSVLGKFESGTVLPVIVRWRGRRYWVQKINLHHQLRKGSDTIHYFAATTEAGDCTLAYSQRDLTWTLTEVSFWG